MTQNLNEKKVMLTREGKKQLQIELEHLITAVRPKVIDELKEAREQGDLSENADYDAARAKQAEVESRIIELETILAHSEIIADPQQSSRKRATSSVQLGSIVKLHNLSKNFDMEVKIVGAIESDPFASKISNETPLAKAILTHKVNDVVEVKGTKNPYQVKIIKIR